MFSSRLLAALLFISIALLANCQMFQRYQNRPLAGVYNLDEEYPWTAYKRGFQFHAARGKRGDGKKYGYFPSRGRRSEPQAENDQMY